MQVYVLLWYGGEGRQYIERVYASFTGAKLDAEALWGPEITFEKFDGLTTFIVKGSKRIGEISTETVLP